MNVYLIPLGGDRFEPYFEPEDDVGRRARALELQPPDQRRAIAGADEAHGAAAFLLEVRGDLRPRAPLGDEALVGVDHQLGLLLARERGREHEACRKHEGRSHGLLRSTGGESRGPPLAFPPPV